MEDMISFLFILFVILISFGVSIQALLQPQSGLFSSNSSNTYIRDIFYIPFYRLAGEAEGAQGGKISSHTCYCRITNLKICIQCKGLYIEILLKLLNIIKINVDC